MKKILIILLILLSPFLFFSISLRLAFTEPFLEVVYLITNFPDDGIPREEKLKVAKLGLRAVLSEDGIKEFINSGLFNEREILHMQDVKTLLSNIFAIGYFIVGLWIIIVLLLRDSTQIAKSLFFASLISEIVLIAIFVFIYAFFDKAFEIFHLIFFDPYSWRFYPGDMLIYVYPIDFWEKAFLSLFLLYLLITNVVFSIAVLFLARKKALPFEIKSRTLDK